MNRANLDTFSATDRRQTISREELVDVTGGVAKDVGTDYTRTVKNDLADTGNRAIDAARAVRQKDWGSAAVNSVRAGADALHSIKDIAAPVTDLVNVFKS